MATRFIGLELTIKNEAEFRKQIKAVNNNLAAMKSEMAKVSAEFDGQANSAEALRRKQAILQQQYDQQKEKVRSLAQMLESAKKEYDENSDIVLKYQKQLNYATIDLIKFDRELKNTDKYLDEAAQSADGTASSIDEFGKAVKDAGDEGSDGMGQLKEIFGQLGEAVKGGDINGVVAALGSMKGLLVGGADQCPVLREPRPARGPLAVSIALPLAPQRRLLHQQLRQLTAGHPALGGVLHGPGGPQDAVMDAEAVINIKKRPRRQHERQRAAVEIKRNVSHGINLLQGRPVEGRPCGKDQVLQTATIS